MNLNYHLYRFKYRFAPHLKLSKPVDVSLELASTCNMRCSYCYHADQKTLPFQRGLMDIATATKIISEAAKLGVPSIKLNWRGESTQNPNFYNICNLAKYFNQRHGDCFVDRLTNSNFKFDTNRRDIFMGLACQTKVKVSYDSFQKKIFETQRARGDHDLTTRNIDTFYNWPGRKTDIVIQAVRTSLNKDEDFESEIRKRWPTAQLSVREVVDGRRDESIGDLANETRDTENRQTCIQAHARLIFNHEGTAFPCCPDIKETLKLGSIKNSTIAEIWNSPTSRRLRQDLLNKTAFKYRDACKNCSSYESYKGYKPAWNS